MQKLELPAEFKLENYERRVQTAVFDRIDLVLSFRAGRDHRGVTVKGFLDAIVGHDALVKKIEEKMFEIDELKRIYRKKNRLFRNLDSAWNVMLDNPIEFFEYQALLPRMRNVEERLKKIQDPIIKGELEQAYNRFKILEPKCSKQLIIYNTFSDARDEKDAAMKDLVNGEADLTKLKKDEKHLASLISDDHILADESKQTLSSLFPNVHVGFILSKINGEAIENLPYDEAMSKVLRSKSPHEAEFLRYDYRFDPFTQTWHSLAELREIGVCVEDPLLQRMNFVNIAGKGDVDAVRDLLLQGEDPDSSDLSGNTALTVAAANCHAAVVDLLVEAGANVNCRDKNMMTPLLYCVSRGYLEIARQLINYGADKHASDKNHRTMLYYAVLSGNEEIVKLFLHPERCNEPDYLWGFTPMHLAANQGNLNLCKSLLKMGCSLYCLDKKRRTAEIVADEARHKEVAELLKEERTGASGQFVHRDERNNINYWIGDQSSMDVRFCADADISVVLYVSCTLELPPYSFWLCPEEVIAPTSILVDNGNDANRRSKQGGRKDVGQYVNRHNKRSNTNTKNNNSRTAATQDSEQSSSMDNHHPKSTSSAIVSTSSSSSSAVAAISTTNSTALVPVPDSKSSSRPRRFRKNNQNDSDEMAKADTPESSSVVGRGLKNKRFLDASFDNDDDDDDEIESKNEGRLLRLSNNGETTATERKEGHDDGVLLLENGGTENNKGGDAEKEEEEEDDEIAFESFIVDCHDEDKTTHSWEKLNEKLSPITRFLLERIERGNCNILICDETCISLAPAILASILVIKYQMRTRDTLEMVKEVRPSSKVSQSMKRGLDQLQKTIDDKILSRLNHKLRTSNVFSCGF